MAGFQTEMLSQQTYPFWCVVRLLLVCTVVVEGRRTTLGSEVRRSLSSRLGEADLLLCEPQVWDLLVSTLSCRQKRVY